MAETRNLPVECVQTLLLISLAKWQTGHAGCRGRMPSPLCIFQIESHYLPKAPVTARIELITRIRHASLACLLVVIMWGIDPSVGVGCGK